MKDIERTEWIDNLKGFGVLSVMLYHHTGISGLVKDYLISFNVPLFFIVYGYLASDKKQKLSTFFKKIVYPYLFFSMISILIWIPINKTEQNFDGITHLLLGVAYGVGSHPWLSFNIALWFLPCLFISGLIFDKIKIYSINYPYFLLTIIFLLVIAFDKISFRLPWGLDLAPMAILFMTIGYIARQNNIKILSSSRHTPDVLIITIVISYLVASINGHVGMGFKEYGNIFLFVLGGLSGTLFWYVISRNYHGFISVIGRHSLILFAMHLPVYFLLNIVFLDFLKITIDLHQPQTTIIYIVLTISLLLPLSVFSRKHLPKLIKLTAQSCKG